MNIKNHKITFGAGLTALAFSTILVPTVQAQTCAAVPTCNELGYNKSETECAGLDRLKCPFDKTKYFCPSGGSGSGTLSIGDILFSDMTTGPNPVTGKTPIGIVFDTINRLAIGLDVQGYIGFNFPVCGYTWYNTNWFSSCAGKYVSLPEINNLNEPFFGTYEASNSGKENKQKLQTAYAELPQKYTQKIEEYSKLIDAEIDKLNYEESCTPRCYDNTEKNPNQQCLSACMTKCSQEDQYEKNQTLSEFNWVIEEVKNNLDDVMKYMLPSGDWFIPTASELQKVLSNSVKIKETYNNILNGHTFFINNGARFWVTDYGPCFTFVTISGTSLSRTQLSSSETAGIIHAIKF